MEAINKTTIKAIKKGEYFVRKLGTDIVYIRGDYVREAKKYSCVKADDMNAELMLKGDTIVFIGFTY